MVSSICHSAPSVMYAYIMILTNFTVKISNISQELKPCIVSVIIIIRVLKSTLKYCKIDYFKKENVFISYVIQTRIDQFGSTTEKSIKIKKNVLIL